MHPTDAWTPPPIPGTEATPAWTPPPIPGTDATPADAAGTPIWGRPAANPAHVDLTAQLQSKVALMSQIQQRLINARTESSYLQMLLNESRTEQLRLEAALLDHQERVITLQRQVQEQMEHDQHLIEAASDQYVRISHNQMQEYIDLRSNALSASTLALDRRLATALGPTAPWMAASDSDEDDEDDPRA